MQNCLNKRLASPSLLVTHQQHHGGAVVVAEAVVVSVVEEAVVTVEAQWTVTNVASQVTWQEIVVAM